MKQFLSFFLLMLIMVGYCSQDENIVLRLGGANIVDPQSKLNDLFIRKLFQEKYKREPSDDDHLLLENIRVQFGRKVIASEICKIIDRHAKEKLFNEVVTQEAMQEYAKKRESQFSFDVSESQAYLDSITFIRQSDDKNKYEVAYEKYMKGYCSYNFFKKNIDKPYFEKFLRKRLEERLNNEISKNDLDALFAERLPQYIYQKAVDAEKFTTTPEPQSSQNEIARRNQIILQWYIKEGNKLGCRIINSRYGNTLEEIITQALSPE